MNRRPAALTPRDALRHRAGAYRRHRTEAAPARRWLRLDRLTSLMLERAALERDARERIRIESRIQRLASLRECEAEGYGAANADVIAWEAATRDVPREAIA